MRSVLTARDGVALAVFLCGAALGFSGCVGDDATPLTPSSDSGADGSAAGDPCPEYCSAVSANCAGELRAFDNPKQCRATCAFLPPGTAGDKTNSVACRLPAARAGGGKETCANASAYGGGVCGSRCDSFCELVDKNCIGPLGAAAPYRTKADCVEACNTMVFDPTGVEGMGQAIVGKDTLNCRMLHLILSIDDRAGHCPHVAVVSSTCKNVADAGTD